MSKHKEPNKYVSGIQLSAGPWKAWVIKWQLYGSLLSHFTLVTQTNIPVNIIDTHLLTATEVCYSCKVGKNPKNQDSDVMFLHVQQIREELSATHLSFSEPFFNKSLNTSIQVYVLSKCTIYYKYFDNVKYILAKWTTAPNLPVLQVSLHALDALLMFSFYVCSTILNQ